jgi:hypothetical protein
MLMGEQRMKVFGRGVLKIFVSNTEEVTGGWRKLLNKDVICVY